MNADDDRLIAECLQGRSAAFGPLVERYQDRLFNSVLRLVNDPEDARDVVQEAFLSAYQALGSFKGDSQFFTWLYRIAVNTAITFRRKKKAVVRLYADDDQTGLDPADEDESGRPGFLLEMAEREQRVHEALKRLSSEHRTVLVLKDMDGRKYEEMADVLGVPIGTIRSRLHRARLELREILLRMEQGPEG